jgi:spore coat protein CotH
MGVRSVLRVLAVMVALVAGNARLLCAQTADELFDAQTWQEIRLSINSMDLQTLEANYLDNTFYTADLHWRNLRIRNVGIRSRGSASRSGTKLGIQIEFDRYVGGQQFLGMKSLVLDNLWQDPAMIRERVAMAFFARMGQAAPRESFCRLFINDVSYGVYTIVEAVTPELLTRTSNESGSYVFEYKYLGPYHFEYLGSDLENYKPLFEPRAHELEPDAVLYSPIRDLVREINEPDDAVWRERVEKYLDLTQFVTYVGIETFLAEADGVLGFGGMANFYLSRSGSTTPHRLVPWDKDLSFSDPRSPLFLNADDNILFHRAMAFPDLRTTFLDVLAASARSALSRGWLYGEIVRNSALIAEDAAQDSRKPYSNDDIAEAVAALKRFALQRPFYVLNEVSKARRSP